MSLDSDIIGGTVKLAEIVISLISGTVFSCHTASGATQNTRLGKVNNRAPSLAEYSHQHVCRQHDYVHIITQTTFLSSISMSGMLGNMLTPRVTTFI